MQNVIVVPYDPSWVEKYEFEAEKIKPIFADNFIAINHIGSTSVPGLCAKPIIDILLEVRDIELVDLHNPEMEALGYEVRGEFNIPGRRFFIKGQENRTHHVHTFKAGSIDALRHLSFRNYLRSHPHEAQQYGELKTMLANKYPQDIHSYVLSKNDFVKMLEEKALAWSAANY